MNRSRPLKRKLPPAANNLQRRVRRRKDEPAEPEILDATTTSASDSSASENEGEDLDSNSSSNSDPGSHSDEEGESVSESATERPPPATHISFGALAKAQATITSANSDPASDPDSNSSSASFEAEDRSKTPKSSSSAQKRTSKNAPAEQSSKRAVPRRRSVLSASTLASQRPAGRDPRFLATFASASTSQNSKAAAEAEKRNYAFLSQYRLDELAALRTALKKTKDGRTREKLAREIQSAEGKLAAAKAREREEKVAAEHRKQERDAARLGKKPFYLKKSETKRRVLVEKFRGMKGKQVDKAIERRRKKVAGRERKELPLGRRERD